MRYVGKAITGIPLMGAVPKVDLGWLDPVPILGAVAAHLDVFTWASLVQVLGLSAQDVHDLYMQKNKVNFQRQDSGYAVKDHKDNENLKV